MDEKTREIVGYDVDFVRAIAKKLGVKLELKPVTSASRMPQLVEGNIDMIAATMTKTAERAKQIDFSYTYFYDRPEVPYQKRVRYKVSPTMNGKRIGTAKRFNLGAERLKAALPKSTILSFDDYPQAFLAFQQGKVCCSDYRRIDPRQPSVARHPTRNSSKFLTSRFRTNRTAWESGKARRTFWIS